MNDIIGMLNQPLVFVFTVIILLGFVGFRGCSEENRHIEQMTNQGFCPKQRIGSEGYLWARCEDK